MIQLQYLLYLDYNTRITVLTLCLLNYLTFPAIGLSDFSAFTFAGETDAGFSPMLSLTGLSLAESPFLPSAPSLPKSSFSSVPKFSFFGNLGDASWSALESF